MDVSGQLRSLTVLSLEKQRPVDIEEAEWVTELVMSLKGTTPLTQN
jgi:hypothetical protein